MDEVNQLIHCATIGDGKKLTTVLTKSNPVNFASINTEFLDYNIQFPNEVLKQISYAFVNYNKSLSSYYPGDHFNALADLLKFFNRYAETQKVWVIETLIQLTKQLINLAVKADDFISKNPASGTRNVGDFENESCLIKTSRIVHNSVKLCLNDRNEDLASSRKSQIYFFVGLELKIYFKIQNRDLAKNMEKVLISKKNELPDLNKISKSQAITYLYYSGATACGNADFKGAYLKFQKALQLCSKQDVKHKEAILVYLIPLKFLITKKLVNFTLVNLDFKRVSEFYTDLQLSLKRGDLKKFDLFFDTYETFFLKKNLFIVIENIRNFVVLKLIKRVYLFNKQHHHLPINLITRGIEFSKYHSNNTEHAQKNISIFSNDETECVLANLIYKGFIKGYLSHTNGILVLSRNDPFPKQVKHDDEI